MSCPTNRSLLSLISAGRVVDFQQRWGHVARPDGGVAKNRGAVCTPILQRLRQGTLDSHGFIQFFVSVNTVNVIGIKEKLLLSMLSRWMKTIRSQIEAPALDSSKPLALWNPQGLQQKSLQWKLCGIAPWLSLEFFAKALRRFQG